MDKTVNETLAEVLQYAKLGWPVFPLHTPEGDGCSCGWSDCSQSGKHPRTYHGVKDATTEPERIRRWWQRWPEANIGLDVGQAGVVVLDIDPRHGGRIDALPLHRLDRMTPTVQTGGRGWHLFYRAPIGFEISNSGQRLPTGVDIRSRGGYVILPSSLHASGRRYTWLPERTPWNTLLLPLPASLLPMLKMKEDISARSISRSAPPQWRAVEATRHPYIQRALESELEAVAGATEGTRNNRLNQAAFSLGQFVADGLLPQSEVVTRLEAAARAAGLAEQEIRPTIASGLKAGLSCPRRAWPDISQIERR